jgi:hypothetical protein
LGVERPLYSRPPGDGNPHVEYSDGEYAYVQTERGVEFGRRTSSSADDILYWLSLDVVLTLATDFEVAHRMHGRSYRRLLYEKELELLRRVNPAWAERRRGEIEAILVRHPYDDVREG